MFADNVSYGNDEGKEDPYALDNTQIPDTQTTFIIPNTPYEIPDTLQVAYKLHGQTRRYKFVYIPEEDGGLTLHWGIVRNLKLWTGTYSMSATAVKDGNTQSYLMPEDGNHITLPDNETFGIISGSALADLKKRGEFIYNGALWRYTGTGESSFGPTFEVEDPEEGTKMTILDNHRLPLILSMQGNPLEIDWTMR